MTGQKHPRLRLRVRGSPHFLLGRATLGQGLPQTLKAMTMPEERLGQRPRAAGRGSSWGAALLPALYPCPPAPQSPPLPSLPHLFPSVPSSLWAPVSLPLHFPLPCFQSCPAATLSSWGQRALSSQSVMVLSVGWTGGLFPKPCLTHSALPPCLIMFPR